MSIGESCLSFLPSPHFLPLPYFLFNSLLSHFLPFSLPLDRTYKFQLRRLAERCELSRGVWAELKPKLNSVHYSLKI